MRNHTMIKFKKALGAGALMMALAGATLAASASSANAAIGSGSPAWPFGCSSQYVCLYTGAAGTYPSGPHTNYKFYGFDNFSNVLGYHWMVNNQTGGAKVYPCLGYNGTNCSAYTFYWPDGPATHYIKAGWALSLNFTPINSIRLTP
jgi:hypothetical protein